jgi:hypothetical protein
LDRGHQSGAAVCSIPYRKDHRLWRNAKRPLRIAGSVPVGCYQPSHRSSVTVRIGPTVPRGTWLYIGTRQNVANEIRVRCINTRIDDRDDYAGPFAIPLCLRNVEEAQLPLLIPDVSSPARHSRKHDAHENGHGK